MMHQGCQLLLQKDQRLTEGTIQVPADNTLLGLYAHSIPYHAHCWFHCEYLQSTRYGFIAMLDPMLVSGFCLFPLRNPRSCSCTASCYLLRVVVDTQVHTSY